jgi:uncharacterized protein YndB with AHSA1/START domain
MVFVTDDRTECSFRGTYLEIERPTPIVDTWLFEVGRMPRRSRRSTSTTLME